MTKQEILTVAKPILFNTEMARAILDGYKTATRRVIKPRYRNDEAGFQVITTMNGEFVRVEKVDEDECGIFADGTERYVNPPYKPGDYLYVRETWAKAWNVTAPVSGLEYIYKASCERIAHVLVPERGGKLKWRPSIHMPKEAARIFLRVEEVRAERLQDIDDKGVVAEGLKIGDPFDDLWNNTIKKADLSLYGWDANPWVWVIEFERVFPNK